MKTYDTHRANPTVPTLSIPLSCGEGEGVGGNDQTTVQALPGKKPNWRCGAPNGNRNAAKTIPSLCTLQKRVRALKRRVRAALAEIEGQGLC